MTRSYRSRLLRTGLWAFAIIWMAPYLWMIATSFKSRLDITARPPRFLFSPTTDNFAWSYNGQDILPLFGNSLIVALGTTLAALVVGVPAAYFFARHRSRFTRKLFLFILSTRIAPPIALSLPFFIVFTQVGLRGTYAAIIIIHTAFNLSFVVWLMEGFIADIPEEIEMAAQVDGRTRLGAFFRVVLPLALPGTGVAGLFTFIASWNEYMMASLLSSSQTRPITPALPGFIAQATTQWGSFCVIAMLSSVPILLLVIVSRHYLDRGLSLGVVHK